MLYCFTAFLSVDMQNCVQQFISTIIPGVKKVTQNFLNDVVFFYEFVQNDMNAHFISCSANSLATEKATESH